MEYSALGLKKILTKHLRIPKKLIQEIGINPSILLTELINKELYLLEEWKLNDGFFFHEKKYIEKGTALTIRKIDPAKSYLEEHKLITTRLWDGKKVQYKINSQALIDIFFHGNSSIDSTEVFYELLLDDGYITYSLPLAHSIGVNETIFIQNLIGKRRYYQKTGQLNNGFFFASNSEIEKDVCLSSDQQGAIIKKLREANLIHVEYSKDNTRYFCLNDSEITKLDLLNVNETKGKENTKKEESKTILNNPFNKPETTKSREVEATFLGEGEMTKSREVEATKSRDWNDISRIENIQIPEVETTFLGVNEIENKIKNNTQQQMELLLLELWIEIKNIESLIQEYGAERFQEVCRYIKNNKNQVAHPSGFLIDSLKNKYDLKTTQEKQVERTRKHRIAESVTTTEENITKSDIEAWIIQNPQEYEILYKKFKDENKDSTFNSRERIIVSKVKAHIKQNIILK